MKPREIYLTTSSEITILNNMSSNVSQIKQVKQCSKTYSNESDSLHGTQKSCTYCSYPFLLTRKSESRTNGQCVGGTEKSLLFCWNDMKEDVREKRWGEEERIQFNQYNTTLLPSVSVTAYTRDVLWCQAHSSHIHANHKTIDFNNNSKKWDKMVLINKSNKKTS